MLETQQSIILISEWSSVSLSLFGIGRGDSSGKIWSSRGGMPRDYITSIELNIIVEDWPQKGGDDLHSTMPPHQCETLCGHVKKAPFQALGVLTITKSTNLNSGRYLKLWGFLHILCRWQALPKPASQSPANLGHLANPNPTIPTQNRSDPSPN